MGDQPSAGGSGDPAESKPSGQPEGNPTLDGPPARLLNDDGVFEKQSDFEALTAAPAPMFVDATEITLSAEDEREKATEIERSKLATDSAPPPESFRDANFAPPQGRYRLANFILVILVAAIYVLLVYFHGLDWGSLAIGLGAALILMLVFAVKPRRIILYALTLGVLTFGCLEIWNGAAFHTLDLSGPPPALTVCGETFTAPVSPNSLRNVGTTPSGMSILAVQACSALKIPQVFIRAGAHSYFVYKRPPTT